MMFMAPHARPAGPPSPPVDLPRTLAIAGPRTLDDLAALPAEALALVYRTAVTPALPALDGDLAGRILAVPVLPRWMFGALRRFAAWTLFPWRGKTFHARDGARGDGLNLLFSDAHPRRWFRFSTSSGPSRAGAFDTVQLDYGNADNPWPVRALRDELREVAPGLYLGLGHLMWRKQARLILYFALARP